MFPQKLVWPIITSKATIWEASADVNGCNNNGITYSIFLNHILHFHVDWLHWKVKEISVKSLCSFWLKIMILWWFWNTNFLHFLTFFVVFSTTFSCFCFLYFCTNRKPSLNVILLILSKSALSNRFVFVLFLQKLLFQKCVVCLIYPFLKVIFSLGFWANFLQLDDCLFWNVVYFSTTETINRRFVSHSEFFYLNAIHTFTWLRYLVYVFLFLFDILVTFD